MGSRRGSGESKLNAQWVWDVKYNQMAAKSALSGAVAAEEMVLQKKKSSTTYGAVQSGTAISAIAATP